MRLERDQGIRKDDLNRRVMSSVFIISLLWLFSREQIIGEQEWRQGGQLGGYSKFRQELMMTSRSGHGEQRLYEVTFLIPGLQMRKVRLRKAKDLSKLGIKSGEFFLLSPVPPY